MTDQVSSRCTLVCLATGEVIKPSAAALNLVHLFGGSCQFLLVSPMEDDCEETSLGQSRRVEKHLAAHSDRVGIKTEVRSLSFRATLQHVAELKQTDILIIAQPDHPLDRQTLSFRELSTAALKARAATLYVPPGDHTKKSKLFVVEASGDQTFTQHAKAVAAARQLQPVYLDTLITFAEIKTSITYTAALDQPALLIVSADWVSRQSYSASRLAASFKTPILILGDEKISTTQEALRQP